MYSSSLDAFPLTNGVHTVIAAPSGYHIDFENPHRDTYTMTRIYGCFAIGLLLSFVFLFQNLYVKVFVLRKLDAPTGQCYHLPTFPWQGNEAWSLVNLSTFLRAIVCISLAFVLVVSVQSILVCESEVSPITR